MPARRPAPQRRLRCAAETSGDTKPGANIELVCCHCTTAHLITTVTQDEDSDIARKKAAADALRAQEKFMTIGTGEAQCKGCGYTYDPKLGDPEYPVAKGVKFEVR